MNKISNKITALTKNKEAKTLAGNFMWLSALKVIGYIFPLITMPYLARVIGVDGFGKIAFASAILVWIQTITDWGFNFTATRDIAKSRDDAKKVSEIFSDTLWSRLLLMFVSLIILVVLVISIPKFRENTTIIFVSFLMVPGHILFPDWFFQAIERMKYITILNIVSKLIFTIAIFVFIKDKNDYVLQPLLSSLGYLVAGIVSMYVITCKWKYTISHPNPKRIIDRIKHGADVFLNNLFPNIYGSFTTILLGFFCGSTANGIYDAALKFAATVEQINQVVSRTFFPFLSRRIDKHDLYLKFSLLTTLLISAGLYICAPFLINAFFTAEFSDSIIVLRILVFMIIGISLSNIYGTNYMIIQGDEKPLRNITIVCSIIGLLISFPLIYFYSYIGKALVLAITNCLLGLFSMLYVVRKNNKTQEKHLNN